MPKQRILKASLVIAAIALTAPFAISILSLCGLAALAGLRSMSIAVPLQWIIFFDAPHTAVALLFADPFRYLVFSLLALLLLLGWLTVPSLLSPALPRGALQFWQALWGERQLDTVLQVVLIFSGVLGSLGLLAERPEGEHGEKERQDGEASS